MNQLGKILFIGDPLLSLKLKFDSSLALCESALKSGKKVFWCDPQNICYFNNEIFVDDCHEIISVSTEELKHAKVFEERVLFSSFHVCFIRKDPPFDEEYKNLCWVLSTQNKVKIINRAESLLSFHEKSLHWLAYSEGFLNTKQMIPTCLTHHTDVVTEFCDQFSHPQKFICKPWLGHGGEGVILFENKNLLLDYLSTRSVQHFLIQTFIADIATEGDRRVLIANGKIVCDFVRIPAQGQVASNLAQGGSAILRVMTPEQKNICVNLAKFLKEKGILFAGVDLIGTYVGEINITSPTGIRTYESLTNSNVSNEIFKLLLDE